MMMEKNIAALFMSMMALALLSTTSNASRINDISCLEATPLLLPCVPFLEATDGQKPSDSCCSAANTIVQKATSPQNRKDLCECFKSAASGIGLNPEQLKQLPQLCNFTLSFPLDPNVDCNT
ncbi:putative plant lipid transfer protein/Par allergen [Lupinus albus]|uniref:Putative plant lipid transfer protein/Par allergen n=1 Tax=Lupinus albus TaxID=3870 RepID=A0A6A4PMT3_LUPAL|nr:putative plant lipid transfer protein/Par allergen [Lupinus albus]